MSEHTFGTEDRCWHCDCRPYGKWSSLPCSGLAATWSATDCALVGLTVESSVAERHAALRTAADGRPSLYPVVAALVQEVSR
jgi:hypothetical protein